MKALFYALFALYPVAIFLLLVVFSVPIRLVSLVVVVLGAGFFLTFTAKKSRNGFDAKALLSATLLTVLGAVCFLTNEALFLKAYSLVINITLLFVFGSTLFFPPNICFRFACLADKNIAGSNYENNVLGYCKKVTIVWCVFFTLNGLAAAFTTFYDFGSDTLNNRVWSVYNGGISYAIMIAIFIVEGVVRYIEDKKMVKAYPITKFTAHSWARNRILCYEGTYNSAIKDKKFKTFGDLLEETAILRGYFNSGHYKYLVHIEDYWLFLCTFIALLQCKREVHLVQNTSSEFLREVTTSDMEYLTDGAVSAIINNGLGAKSADDDVGSETGNTKNRTIDAAPVINSDETRIFLYTSGSTGHPKKVLQRMTEFECDNAFVIKKWGEEIIKRKLVSTVSAHHIYGFLFDITLPFTLGIPFKRSRIEHVEEFEALSDTSYIIITTPAFLKRVVESENKLPLKDAFIFTSGGACSKDLAEKTQSVMGFCPLEVYGSTETSGIAYRQQSTDGEKYTPFDNAKVWLGEDGCLRIISPYIKDPAGFATSDLAQMFGDGKFILKGRCDSIVKIEEKRISLTEVEGRLMDSGLVKDVKVIALENDVRQYLAAVIALNLTGQEKFKGLDKHFINEYFHNYLLQYFENVTLPKKWRFVDAIPCDTQGKKHKEDIARLFE